MRCPEDQEEEDDRRRRQHRGIIRADVPQTFISARTLFSRSVRAVLSSSAFWLSPIRAAIVSTVSISPSSRTRWCRSRALKSSGKKREDRRTDLDHRVSNVVASDDSDPGIDGPNSFDGRFLQIGERDG